MDRMDGGHMTGCDAEPREGKDNGGKGGINAPRRGEGFKQRARRGIVLTASSGETIIDNLCLIQTSVLHVGLWEQRAAAL